MPEGFAPGRLLFDPVIYKQLSGGNVVHQPHHQPHHPGFVMAAPEDTPAKYHK